MKWSYNMYCTYSRSVEVPSPKTDYPILPTFPIALDSTSNTSPININNPNIFINPLPYFCPSGEVPSYNYSLNLRL
jgi:hypothetical protein